MRDSLGFQKREIKTFFSLFLIFGIGLFSYFLPGDLLTLDAHSHLARTWIFKDILTHEHQFPIWTNRWYCGFPIELYYGFFYYQLNALWVLLTGDLIWGTKSFLWGTHLLSGLCFYWLAKQLTSSRSAALFSALFFVFSPQHFHPFVEGGRHPLSLIFLFLPLIFYYYEKCQEEQRELTKAAPTLALLLALSLFTHLQFGLYTLLALLSVSLPRMIMQSYFPDTRILAKYTLRLLVWTGILYLLFTAWITLPALQDTDYLVQSKSKMSQILFGKWMPKKALHNLSKALWKGQDSFDHVYYMGIIPCLIALFAYYPKRLSIISLSYALAFSGSFIWMLNQTRYVYFSFFLLAILSAYGWANLFSFFSPGRKKAAHIFIGLLYLLLMLDFIPRLRTTPYKKINNQFIASLQKTIEQTGTSGRILCLRSGRGTLWSSLNVIDTNASSVFGGIPQNATLSHAYIAAVSTQASQEIFDKRQSLSSFCIEFFRLLNIQSVAITERKTSFQIDLAHPIWFSTHLIPISKQNNSLEKETWLTVREQYDARKFDITPIQNYLALMQPNSLAGTLENILVEDMPTLSLNPTTAKPIFKIHACKETHATVRIDYESDTEGFGWLPYAYFPYLDATIDEKKIPFYESVMHFLVVPLEKGRHTLQINAGISLERKFLCLLAVITFCISTLTRFYPHANSRFRL